MTALTDADFAALWDAAASFADAAQAVAGRVGAAVPRWAVLARAHALRKAGAALREHADERPPVAPLARAKELAAELMARHGLTAWAFGFNANVRRAGVCRYPARGRPGRIELSRHYVARNSEEEIRDTILHEIAHARVGPGHGHDAAWKAECVAVGARPVRCYGAEVAMPKGRWRATCGGCGREHDRHRRPKSLTGWHCRPCGKDRGALEWRVVAG